MADGINLRLRRRDMNVFRTIDQDGRRPVVHVAGKHPVALCPSCSRPSVTTNGTGWRDVIDVVRTVVVTLSICVRRFVCEFEDCDQRSFDERFEGIGRGGASDRALAFFADLQRGRATRRVRSTSACRIIACASPSGKDTGLLHDVNSNLRLCLTSPLRWEAQLAKRRTGLHQVSRQPCPVGIEPQGLSCARV